MSDLILNTRPRKSQSTENLNLFVVYIELENNLNNLTNYSNNAQIHHRLSRKKLFSFFKEISSACKSYNRKYLNKVYV